MEARCGAVFSGSAGAWGCGRWRGDGGDGGLGGWGDGGWGAGLGVSGLGGACARGGFEVCVYAVRWGWDEILGLFGMLHGCTAGSRLEMRREALRGSISWNRSDGLRGAFGGLRENLRENLRVKPPGENLRGKTFFASRLAPAGQGAPPGIENAGSISPLSASPRSPSPADSFPALHSPASHGMPHPAGMPVKATTRGQSCQETPAGTLAENPKAPWRTPCDTSRCDTLNHGP